MKMRICLAVLMLSLAVPNAIAADPVEVDLGHSQVIGPVDDMATVIIGDDQVADATLGGGGTIILTGKAVGSTNIIILDETGREVLHSSISVVPLERRPTTNIRITKGVSAVQDYVCGAADGCTPVAGKVPASHASATVVDDAAEDEATDNPEVLETDAPADQEQVSLDLDP